MSRATVDPPPTASALVPAAALAMAVLFWSGNFVTGRAVRDLISPESLVALRWAVAILVFLPFVAARAWRHRAALRRRWAWLLVAGATGVALFQVLIYRGVAETSAVNAALVIAATPGLMLLWTCARDRRAPRLVQAAGLALSLAGVAVIVAEGDIARLAALSFNRGDLWIALAAVVWCIYTLLLRSHPKDLPADVGLLGAMTLGLAMVAPFAAPTLWATPPDFTDPRIAGAVVYVAVFASLLAFIFWGYGVRHLGPVRAAQFINLQPVFSAVLAALLLGEALSAYHAPGAALVLGGVWLVNRV